jgi:hypothetical protein
MPLATTSDPPYTPAAPRPVDTARHRVESLRAEARTLGRWIVGRAIDEELVDRYAVAHAHLPLDGDGARDAALLAFALAHPRLLPALDAAAALVRPRAALHRKALLMTAILETSPQHAVAFLPHTRGWLALATLAASVGLTTAAQVAVGLPLLAVVERRA